MPDEHPEDEPAGQEAADGEANRPADDGDQTASVDDSDTDVPADPDQPPQAADELEPSPDAPDSMSLAWGEEDDDEPDNAGTDAPSPWSGWAGRNTANEANERIFGELVVHYTDRTISLPMDADAALRAIAGWRYGEPRIWEDQIAPEIVPGRVSWAALSLEGVLALMWYPGLPPAARPARMTVDPAVA